MNNLQLVSKENLNKEEDFSLFKFSKKPLLKFKLEYKSPHWIIYIHSEYDNLTDRKWVAVTDNKKSTLEDEWGNSVTYYKVRFFESQSQAYDYIRTSFDPSTIEEYIPPAPGILVRIGNYLFGSRSL